MVDAVAALSAWVVGVSAWIRFAKSEVKNGEIPRARNVYQRAVDKLADDEDAEQLFVAFAEFEEKCKDVEKARCIYKSALDHILKGKAEDLYRKFVAFEKQYGDKEGIEDESLGSQGRIREAFERAVANVPPAQEKRYWQRYIYLWLNYVLYAELDAEDIDRTRDVYKECLALIPHDKFSFAKVWLLAAQFEIRQLNLQGARKILGQALGRAPKDMIFKKYIEIELQLGNIDCCRKLYEKYLEWSSENCYACSKNAELERSLAETERARAIFELAIDQPALDMPELIWKLVRVKPPKKLKKRQPLETVGGPVGYEEYIDYLFPEETESTNLKILEAAYKWKKQKIAPSEY
ncbi:RNA splicing factor [Lithospermum erythrorhizon]|uniref:RNA splicing factor n=1 Tax=Lithospermum erythrorhizon TaxID=34254 RepID=A0AAV3Q2B2_LITER